MTEDLKGIYYTRVSKSGVDTSYGIGMWTLMGGMLSVANPAFLALALIDFKDNGPIYTVRSQVDRKPSI